MTTFEETGLNSEIIKAVEAMGFEHPTPIQEQAIPVILSSEKDLIALAQTGTGKTAAFGLPIIHNIDEDQKEVQALILCPTRELCMQIAKDIKNFSKFSKKVKAVAVYGGSSMETQIKGLRAGAQIVVGTPGRTLDLLKRKALKIKAIKWMVLDEADEMLNMGFKEDLDLILEGTPKEKQTLLFSATMPSGVKSIAKNYMHDPQQITIGRTNTGAENITHEFYVVHSRDRYQALIRLADINPDIYGIIFCRTRRETQEVADKLIQDGYNADALHGGLSQAQRDYVMNRFRSKSLQFLVATDVAARGVDVSDLTHVINYNLPDDPEVYIHRSGRTGRAGRSGTSIAIITTREVRVIKHLERLSGKEFNRKNVPGGQEICEKQLLNMIDRIKGVDVDDSLIGEYLPGIVSKLEGLEREDLIKHFVYFEFKRILSTYKNAKDLNVSHDDRRKDGRRDRDGGRRGDRDGGRRDRDRRDRDGGSKRKRKDDKNNIRDHYDFVGFHMNLGSRHKLNASGLIELINEKTKNRDIKVGKIKIDKKFSFFEVEKGYLTEIAKAFDRAKYFGVPIVVQPAAPTETKRGDSSLKRKKKRGGDGRFKK